MDNVANFYGLDFETDYNLFASEFAEIPAVYIVYTPKLCLEIGQTDALQTKIETHPNTREWLLKSEGDQVYIAFHLDQDLASREEKVAYLKDKMHPIF